MAGDLPGNIDRVALGINSNGANPLNGTIARILYYPKALSATELKELSRGDRVIDIPGGAMPAVLSKDAGNLASLGTDRGIYVPTPGVEPPPLGIVDNSIGDSQTISASDPETAPGTYIVPATGLLNAFVGQAGKYAAWDGDSFTFTTPANGDKRIIQTGPNAGLVYLYGAGAWAQTVTASPGGPYSADQFVTLGATVTAPTKSTTKVVDFIRYADLGDKRMRVEFCYSHDTATAANNGNGQYTIVLPDGMTFNTTKHRIFSGAFANDSISFREALPVGTGQIGHGIYNSQVMFVPYNNNSMRMVVVLGYGEQGIVSSSWYQMNVGFVTYQGSFEFYRN
jgi:hypothetical protein